MQVFLAWSAEFLKTIIKNREKVSISVEEYLKTKLMMSFSFRRIFLSFVYLRVRIITKGENLSVQNKYKSEINYKTKT
jgi:hypothetical protein